MVDYDFDIPVPVRASLPLRERIEILENIPVNGSYFFGDTSYARINSATRKITKRLGHKYVCRTVMKNGNKGVRVWRLPDEENK